MLNSYIDTLDHLKPSSVVTHFGKQADGTWVSGNVAIKSGDYVPLEESGYSISLKYNYEHKLSAPQIVVIDYPHVRFSIGCQLMQMFPKFFGCASPRDSRPQSSSRLLTPVCAPHRNNHMQALAAFAAAAMGVSYDAIRSGKSGAGKINPITILVSTEHGTGKTEAAAVAAGLVGPG